MPCRTALPSTSMSADERGAPQSSPSCALVRHLARTLSGRGMQNLHYCEQAGQQLTGSGNTDRSRKPGSGLDVHDVECDPRDRLLSPQLQLRHSESRNMSMSYSPDA